MKHVLLCTVLSIGLLPVNSQFANVENYKNFPGHFIADNGKAEGLLISSQQPNEKMLATVFRAQEFCRIELKDFEWEVEFNLVSATVYFSGTNFKSPEKGVITSKSLKPLKKFMERCAPGTVVIFDNVVVLDPNKEKRPIAGVSYMLH